MPVPAIAAAAAAFVGRLTVALVEVSIALKTIEEALEAIDPNREYAASKAVGVLTDYLNRAIYELQGHGLVWACAWFGLPLDLSKPLTGYTLTQAINDGVLQGTGLRFTNLLDGDSIKRDMRRIALEQVGETMGLRNTGTVKDLVAGMRGYAVKKILQDKDALAALGIPANPAMLAVLARYGQPSPNEPTDFTAEGQSNRDRQAKYRASHTRHWVPR